MDPNFQGLIAFPVTTTDSQGNFDAGAFRALVDRLIAAGVHGLGILASSGGGAYYTEQERMDIASAAVKIVDRRVPLMIGTAAVATSQCIRLSQHAESIGADSLMIAPVSYWPLTVEEVFRHYESVARSVNIPICVYNNPRTTQFDIQPDLVGRLSTVLHIDNFKEIAPDLGRIDQIRKSSAGRITISWGRDSMACEALITGADAWQSAFAGVIPEPCVRVYNLIKKDGNYELARKHFAEIAELCSFFSEKGVIRSEHTALQIMGINAGKPRPPLRLLEGDDAEMLRKYLTSLDLIG